MHHPLRTPTSLCALVLLGYLVCVGKGDDLTELYEKARYYLREFQETYKEIESIHAIRKRSAPKTNEDVSQSIEDLCASYETKKLRETLSNSEEEKVAKEKFIEGKEVDGEKFTGIVLMKVKARPNGAKVNLTFEVSHTSKAFVSSQYSMDSKRYVIEYPEGESGPVLSKVQIEADRSRCTMDPPNTDEEHYIFVLDNGESYGSQAFVDICKFDNEKSWDQWDSWHKSDKREFVQILPLPHFQYLNFPNNGVFIENHKTPGVEIEAIFDDHTTMNIDLVVWDWTQNKFVHDIVEAAFESNGETGVQIERVEILGNREHFIHANVIKETIYNSTNIKKKEDGENKTEKSKAKIQIQVNFGNRELSGLLSTSYRQTFDEHAEGQIVSSLAFDRSFGLKLPYKLSVFPRNTVEFSTEDQQCDQDGNRMYQKFGKNCIVECFVIGNDIKSIFLVKLHPYRPPVKSISSVYHFGMSAMALQNVGPASEENGGKYQCHVITRDGKMHTANIQLRTGGFTKVTSFNLEDTGNGTTLAVCSASGDPPLNISITSESFDKEDVLIKEHLDENPENAPVRTSEEGKASLTVTLDTALQRDYGLLACEATGPGGSDSIYI